MEYESMTVAELKEILKARGLKVGGKKAELIQRLAENETNEPEVLETQTSDEEEKSEEDFEMEDAEDFEEEFYEDEWEDEDDDDYDETPTPILPPMAPERPNMDAANSILDNSSKSEEE